MLCVTCITDSLRLTDKHLQFHKRARGGFISAHQLWVNPLQAVLQKPHLFFLKHTVSASEALLSKYGICHTVLTAPYPRRHLKCECPCHCSGPDSEDVIGHDSAEASHCIAAILVFHWKKKGGKKPLRRRYLWRSSKQSHKTALPC